MVVDVNDFLVELLGYSREQFIGKELWELGFLKDTAASKLNFAELEEKKFIRYENLPLETSDGRRIEVEFVSNVYLVDHKKVIQCNIRDITERKRAEENSNRLGAIVESSDDAIIGKDLNGIITSWNAGAEKLFGYSAKESVGHSILQIVPQDRLNEEEQILDRIRVNELVQHFETVRLKKNGQLIDVSVTVSPIKDTGGNIVGASKVARDITERKRVEQAIGKMQRLLNETQEISKVGGWEYNVAKARVTWTDEVYRIHGVPKGYDPGNPDKDIRFYAPEAQKKMDNAFNRAVEKGEPYDLELQLINAHGKNLWVRTIGKAERSDGKIVRIFGNIMDITERRQAEEEIQKLNAELETRVIERTAQLEIANKELDAFAYSVSHDLRAPLRSIDGFSLVLLDDYANKLDEKGKDSLQRIRAATQRMAQLIDDILGLSRVSRSELCREGVHLSVIADEIATELRRTDPDRDVEFVISPEVRAVGDAQLLHIVLDNLMQNAFKFTSKHAKARIEFGTADRDGTSVCYVRDDGAGFDMQYADKMFSAFQRMHSSVEFPGTGIGLAIVQRIINRHGGAVWAESEVEKGATFYFTLEP